MDLLIYELLCDQGKYFIDLSICGIVLDNVKFLVFILRSLTAILSS